MDATHPIWHTPAVRAAVAAGNFGTLIRVTRMAQNLTLTQAGQICGYSASTMSRIETGRQPLTDVTVLRRYAIAFGIPPQFFGLATPNPQPSGETTACAATVCGTCVPENGDAPVRRRQLLTGLVGVTGATLLGIPSTASAARSTDLNQLVATPGTVAQPVGHRALRSSLTSARSLYESCRYAELSSALPEIIAAAQSSRDAADGTLQESLFAVLADAYSLASSLCTRLNDDALAWVTADRARSAAQSSGNPASQAEAARTASISMRRHGHHATATSLLTETAIALDVDSGSSSLLGTYGSLLCTASYTAAQAGDRSRALDLITEADQAARRIGALEPSAGFTVAQVDVYQIGVRTALGDVGSALDFARRIDIRALPTAERQARFCVDTARAWQRFGDDHKCYHALRIAEHLAPEEVHRQSVRTLVSELLVTRRPTPTGLREFAVRIGATV